MGAVIALAGVGACAPSAVARPRPGPTPTQVDAAKAHAAALAHRLAVETTREQVAGEAMDRAGVRLGFARAALRKLAKELVRQHAAVARGRAAVRAAAVAAYVDADSAAAQFGVLLKSTIVDAGTVTAYADVATARLQDAERRYLAAERRLARELGAEKVAVRKERTQVATATRERAIAVQAAAATKATLRAAKGHVARLIAEQEAAAAAAAAARARAAAEAAARARAAAQAAARAQAEARARAEAAAAIQAATVAETVAGNAPGAAVQSAAQVATTAAGSASASLAANGPLGAVPGLGPLVEAGQSTAGNLAVQTAESYLGVPYVWGGASRSGIDCSGLTMLAWAAAGVALLHSAWYQYDAIHSVALNALEPGDLLFYWFPADGPDPVTHVAMYVGSGPYGTQTLIQAPQPGENVSYAPMYYVGLVGAGRP